VIDEVHPGRDAEDLPASPFSMAMEHLLPRLGEGLVVFREIVVTVSAYPVDVYDVGLRSVIEPRAIDDRIRNGGRRGETAAIAPIPAVARKDRRLLDAGDPAEFDMSAD